MRAHEVCKTMICSNEVVYDMVVYLGRQVGRQSKGTATKATRASQNQKWKNGANHRALNVQCTFYIVDRCHIKYLPTYLPTYLPEVLPTIATTYYYFYQLLATSYQYQIQTVYRTVATTCDKHWRQRYLALQIYYYYYYYYHYYRQLTSTSNI